VATHRNDFLPIAALVLIGSCAFINLMAIPAFEDEGTQLRWMWRFIEHGDWLAPLSYGKPLEGWLMAVLLKVGGGVQPLLAIRAAHVLVGIMGATLTYRLALRLTDRTTALVSAVLFAICPFVVYLERFALTEILLCTAGVWVLLSVLELIEASGRQHGIAAGAALVLAAMCKLPIGFVFMGSVPLALLLMPAEMRRSLLRPPALTRILAVLTPAALLALAIAVVAIIRIHLGRLPGFGLQDLAGIGMGGYTDIAEAIGIARPTLFGELTAQLTLPVVLLGAIGLAVSAVAGDWRQRWLLLMGLLPMLAVGLLARFWYSRYLLFTLPPLIVCATCGWQRLALSAGHWRRAVGLGALALCLGLMSAQSARLIATPITARWSALDRFQYFEGWGSGYGYPEAAKFIREAPQAPPMIYSLDGHGAYQLRNYLPEQWRTRVEPVIYGQDGSELRTQPARLQNLLGHTPAWIIVAEPLLERYLKLSFGEIDTARVSLVEIARFDKPGSGGPLALYRITQQ
jgi:4-amino-4-deoxy-L-arabinose transferase-like glycosyltransferase